MPKKLEIDFNLVTECLPPLRTPVIAVRADRRQFSAMRFESTVQKNVYRWGMLGPGAQPVVIGVLDDIVAWIDLEKCRRLAEEV